MQRTSNDQNGAGFITPEFVGSTGSIFGCLGTVAGVLFALIGIAIFGLNAATYSQMESIEGVAIPFERGREGMRGPGPHVEFSVDGKQYVISGQIESELNGHGVGVGTKVDVLYDPDDPNEGVLNSFMDKWLTATVFLVAGLGVTCISRIVAMTRRKR